MGIKAACLIFSNKNTALNPLAPQQRSAVFTVKHGGWIQKMPVILSNWFILLYTNPYMNAASQ
jgi:hypothetical protein